MLERQGYGPPHARTLPRRETCNRAIPGNGATMSDLGLNERMVSFLAPGPRELAMAAAGEGCENPGP